MATAAKQKWNRAHRAEILANLKKYYRDHKFRAKHIARKNHLRRKYKMSLEEYDRLAAKQKERCAICRKYPKKNLLHVDHNHKCCPKGTSCGKCVRGLLCTKCNVSLGWYEKLDPVSV